MQIIYRDDQMTIKHLDAIEGSPNHLFRLERELPDMTVSTLNVTADKMTGKRPKWCWLPRAVSPEELKKFDDAVADFVLEN